METTTYWIWDVQPQPWEAPPFQGFKTKGGRCSCRPGRSDQLHFFKEDLAREFRNAYPDVTPADQPVALVFRFWRNMGAGEERADWTNLTKAAEDALQGVLYVNDRQVVDGRGIIMEQSSMAPNLIAVTISDPPMHDIEIPPRPERPAAEGANSNEVLTSLSTFFQPTT